MVNFKRFLPLFLYVVFLGINANALNFTIKTIKNLGAHLSIPVFIGDLMATKSCAEKHVTFTNLKDFEKVKTISMSLKKNMTVLDLESINSTYIELEDEVIVLKDNETHKLTIISGGKHQKSPRSTPVSVEIDQLKFVYTYENSRLYLEAFDTVSQKTSGKTFVSQRTMAFKNTIDGVEYSVVQGKLRATDLKTGEVFSITTGSGPSAVVKVNDAYLVSSHWGNNTVSIIDKTTHRVVETIPVGKYPLMPVVHEGKIYVSNYGDGSITVVELILKQN